MPFDISIGGDPLTSAQQAVIKMAADRWSQIITGDLPDRDIPGIGVVDDIHINFKVGLPNSFPNVINGTDGQNGTMAAGKWDLLRPQSSRPDSLLPYYGTVFLDPSDSNNDFFDTVFHEMGHALGIGTLWAKKGLVQEASAGDPRFLGLAAATEYGKLYGRPPRAVPVENEGDSGSYGVHFRERALDYEIMTSQAGNYSMGKSNREPVSGVTIGSLQDLGYQVNFAAADPFIPLNPRIV